MSNTQVHNRLDLNNRITLNTKELAEYLGCGKATAVKIGNAAGARVSLNRRVLWNVRLILRYLDGLN